jgi:hypothetical protein
LPARLLLIEEFARRLLAFGPGSFSPITLARSWVRLRTAPLRALPVGLLVANAESFQEKNVMQRFSGRAGSARPYPAGTFHPDGPYSS